MEQNKLHLFVDFDGTVTTRDVGDGIFSRFLRRELIDQGWHDAVIADWKAGRLSSQTCLSQECENTIVTRDELNEELEKYVLTPGFRETAEFCRSNGVPMTILSDGMDYYISYILSKYGLNYLDFRSNRMKFNGSSLTVEFPYADKGCGRCGNCKRWHIDRTCDNGDCVVYVGDGYSDRYAIRSADVIFARHDLARYCSEHGISYYHFDTFHPVLDYMERFRGKD